jgi:putative transposase
MRLIKGFQKEAQMAGFKTLEELNSAFHAWLEIEYHQKKHSTTGETPNDRFRNHINKHPPARITNLEEFNSLFLWRIIRTVSKYGKIRLENNLYYAEGIAPSSKVEVRYDPFDLEEVQIYKGGTFIKKVKANVFKTKQVKSIPEEMKTDTKKVSEASMHYFAKIRVIHNQQKKEQAEQFKYSDLEKKED